MSTNKKELIESQATSQQDNFETQLSLVEELETLTETEMSAISGGAKRPQVRIRIRVPRKRR
jgi:bacteriocin-like protein